jgi:hypothetical protein
MNQHDLALIIHALSAPGASFILGAGASAPAVPTFAQLTSAIASHSDRLSSFPASLIPPSGLRDLMQPVLDQAQRTTDLSEWKAGAMTTATIAAILEQVISRAHRLSLPQYGVFSLFSGSSSIVSFNWDGLAVARCPQRVILHPHGVIQARVLGDPEFDELLFDTQDIDEPSARHWFLPNLILPGEETDPALCAAREKVLQLWMAAPSLIVVGYSFGLASHVSYDEVWLDSFVEACSRNSEAPVHILSPDAHMLRRALCDRIQREINIFAWPVKWNVLASVLLEMAAPGPVPLAALQLEGDRMKAMVREFNVRTEQPT